MPVRECYKMLTYNERQAEIKRLREENEAVLSTPLMSEGSISPMQVGLMSERQKKIWQENAQLKMNIEAQIKLLSRSDEEIQMEENRLVQKAKNSRILQIDSLCDSMSRFISHKTGKLLPKYRKEIEKLQVEKAQLLNS